MRYEGPVPPPPLAPGVPCPTGHRHVRETRAAHPVWTGPEGDRSHGRRRVLQLDGRCQDCGRRVRKRTPPVTFGAWEEDDVPGADQRRDRDGGEGERTSAA